MLIFRFYGIAKAGGEVTKNFSWKCEVRDISTSDLGIKGRDGLTFQMNCYYDSIFALMKIESSLMNCRLSSSLCEMNKRLPDPSPISELGAENDEFLELNRNVSLW